MYHKLEFLRITPLKFCLHDVRGITLVEIIITIGILGVVITPLTTLFVMSAKLNQESNNEFKSILTAQKYMEEILAIEQIDIVNYIYDSNTGSYERNIAQTEDEFEIKIRIIPERSFLYTIEVLIKNNGEIINSLTGSKVIHE